MSELISLSEQRDRAIGLSFAALRDGGVVVFPTDTVYGIGADAFNKQATARIFTIKRRPRSLPLPVLVARHRQAWALAADVPKHAEELAAEFWPGPLTIVLAQAPELDWDLGETGGNIALRMPRHEALVTLLEIVGPIAMTSANLSGERTPLTVHEIRARLGENVDVYVDGGPSPVETGSTIVDLSGSSPHIVREGPIAATEIMRVLGTEAR